MGKMYSDAGNSKGVGEVMDTHIELLLSQKKYAEAVVVAKKKVGVFNQSGDTKAEAHALVHLGVHLLTASQPAKAEKVAEVALGMFAGMNDMDGMKAAKELLDG